MSLHISLEEIKVLAKDAPEITSVKKYVSKYKNEKIVIKYGGNVLIDRNVFNNFILDINILNKLGLSFIVHGGGPRIKGLNKKKIESKFIDGLRVTDKTIINLVEDIIEFNNDIVANLKARDKCKIFSHKKNNIIEVKPEREELGFVGIPNKINFN